MSKTNDKVIMNLKDVSEKYDIPVNRLTSLIRQGKLKAVKSGKEYIVTLNEIHKYLGIETSSESLERELYIKELESKLKNYEIQLMAIKNSVNMINNMILGV